VRKTKLPKREVEICQRLRAARERLGIAQGKCAQELGIERSTLVNYEIARTPLRLNIALRFCRQFVVSEEWLATGRFDACYTQAKRRGIVGGETGRVDAKMEMGIFFRQCMDLLSEPSTLHIPSSTLFSEAYDKLLMPKYVSLVAQFFNYPRICFSDADGSELGINLLKAINERLICLLENEALRRKRKPSDAWRVYVRSVYEASDLIFRKMMGFKSDPEYMESLNWVREISFDPAAKIAFIGEASKPSGKTAIASIPVLN
jgi:transcriptional regulator with XRE-family HTH domain